MELNLENALGSTEAKELRDLNEKMISLFEKWDDGEDGDFDEVYKNEQSKQTALADQIVSKLYEVNPDFVFQWQWSDNNTIECIVGKLSGIGEVDTVWIGNAMTGTQVSGFGIDVIDNCSVSFDSYISGISD